MEAQLALSTALLLVSQNGVTQEQLQQSIDACVRVINNPQATIPDRVRSACEIVGLCYLKEVMK